MIVYTSVFTIEGLEPKDNRYIEILPIWLSFIIKNGDLDGEKDQIGIIIDEITLDYVNNNQTFNVILKNLHQKNNFKFFLVKQPKNISEGMTNRFKILKNSFSVYMDIDCLVLKPIRESFPDVVEEDTICYAKKDNIKYPNFMYITSEGSLLGSNYGLHTVEKNEITEKMTGFTSGLFAFSPCLEVCKFFESVTESTISADPPLYAYDQPHFIKEVIDRLIGKKSDNIIFFSNAGKIGFNDLFNFSKYNFLNLAGEPGNGELHYMKALITLCHIFVAS